MPARRTEVIVGDIDVTDHLVEDLERLRDHFRADPVTRDHRQPHPHTSSRSGHRPRLPTYCQFRPPEGYRPPHTTDRRHPGTGSRRCRSPSVSDGPRHQGRQSKETVRTSLAPTVAPIGSRRCASTSRSTRSSMIASVLSVVWLICAASMLMPASPNRVPPRPRIPGRSGYSSNSRLPSARRSKCLPLTSISFWTSSLPVTAPETTCFVPSAYTTRTVTSLR